MDAYDFIGLAGVALMIYCYARVQWQRDFAKRLSYSVLNLCGALLVAVTFFAHWNLSSFIINTAWGVISIYGIYRCMKYIARAKIVESRLSRRNPPNA